MAKKKKALNEISARASKVLSDFDISNHAYIRLLERFNPSAYKKMHEMMATILSQGNIAQPQNSLKRLLNNRCEPVTYIKYQDRIAVVTKYNVVKTVIDYKENPKHWI